jgi:hypothetical protein
MQDIMTVQPEGTEGHIRPEKLDLLDTVRILSWFKYFNGREAKVPNNLRSLMAWMVSSSENPLEQVLRHKSRGFVWDKEKQNVGIIDVLGMVINGSVFPIAQEVKDEYDAYLYPRYRGKNSGAEPVSDLGREQRAYFLGELDKGIVPQGISVEQVLANRDTDGLATMLRENRLSRYQVKQNLTAIIPNISVSDVDSVVNMLPDNIFPHELLTASRAILGLDDNFYGYYHPAVIDTDTVSAKLVNGWYRKLVDKYAEDCDRKVLVFADVSGSMAGVTISEKSSCNAWMFSTMMAMFAGHVSGSKQFATWTNDATIYQTEEEPCITDYLSNGWGNHLGTDIVASVRSAGEYFEKRGNTPDVLVFISDMQFDHCVGGYGSSSYP